MSSRFSFARVNTYTNAAGETITEHITPEYRPTDHEDFKQWPKVEELLEGSTLSRGVTLEREGELLLDDLVFSREVTPDAEYENGWSREVSPDAECEQLSGWSDIAPSNAFAQQQSRSSSREASPERAWEQPILPPGTEVTTKLITYYTPQASDPDFDYIPLYEKRPAVSEHDRNHAEADDWDTITSREDLDPEVYTRFTVRDGTVIYRKPPYQTDLSEEMGTIGNPTSAHLDGFRVCCNPTEGGPPPLAEVHLVFEVSPDNEPHPKSWLGLPMTCLYEDASRAETLALRIEWKNEEGETESEYLRYTHSPLLFSTTHEGQYDGLGLAIGILNHLENREIVQDKRQFVRDFGKARILNVNVDFFLQKINLQEYLDLPQKIADTGVRRRDTIHQELIAAGAENVTLQFGTFCGAENRTRCDRCLVAHTIATGIAGSHHIETICSIVECDSNCEQAPGTNRCIDCQQVGVDCTYTNDVLEKPALLRALWFAPLTGFETFNVVDPKLANKTGL